MKQSHLSIFCIIGFIDLLAVSMIIPSLPSYIRSLDSGPVMFGFINALYGGIQLFSAPIVGSLSDIHGRRLVLLITLIGSCFGYTLLSLSSSIIMIILSRIPCGLFKHTLDILKLSITDMTTSKDRASSLGRVNASTSIGFILGPALGGYISSLPNGFQWTVSFTSLLFAVNTCLVYWIFPKEICLPHVHHPIPPEDMIEEDELPLQHSKSKMDLIQNDKIQDAMEQSSKTTQSFSQKLQFSKRILFNPSISRTMLFVRLLFAMGAILFRSHFMFVLEDKFHQSVEQRGYILSYMGVLAAISSAFVGHLVEWFKSEKQLIQIGGICLTVSYLSSGLSDSLNVTLFSLIPNTIAVSVLRPCTISVQTSYLQKNEVGSFMGISSSLTSVARTISPLVSGYLMQINPSGPALGASILSCCSGILFYYSIMNSTGIPNQKYKK